MLPWQRAPAILAIGALLGPLALPLVAAVTVTVSPATAVLTVSKTKTFTATLSGATGSVTWSAPLGGSVTTKGVYTAPATPGTYKVRATKSPSYGEATVTVVAAPVATLTAATTVTTGVPGVTASVPAQAGSSYVWTVTGGTLTSGSGTHQITYTPGALGTATLKCIVTNAGGTAATGTKSISVIAEPVLATFAAAKTTLTTGSSTTLTGTFSNGTGAVDNGVGAVTSGTAKSITPTGSTTYTLTVTNAAGTTKTGQAGITVVAAPDATITAATPVPSGATGLLASVPIQPGSTYAWALTGGTITAGSATNQVAYTAGAVGTGNLQCTVTNAAGTATTGTKDVTINPDIVVSVSPATSNQIVGDTQSFSATVSGTANTVVTWSVQEAEGGTIAANGAYTAPATPGTYHVVATSVADTAKSASATVTVTYLDVSGTYKDQDGFIFTLFQSGAQVWGTRRTVTDQILVATLTGKTLTGVANDPNGALISNYVWTFAANGASYTGLYGLGTATPTSSWNGTWLPGVSLEFKPSQVMKIGSTQFCQAHVAGSPNKLVNWAASAGTIDSAGNYTAPATAQMVTITATPDADPAKAVIISIQVTLDGLLDVSGTYKDQDGYTFTLFQSGTQVWGIRRTVADQYLVATLAGRTLTGVANAANGTLLLNYVWTFAANGASYTGLYGSGTATPTSSWNGTRLPGVSLEFKPSQVMKIGSTQFCQAHVAGSPNKLVNWAASAGTIDSAGNYTAPATAQMVTVTATPNADPAKAVTISIQVTLDGLLDVSGTYKDQDGFTFTLFQSGARVWGTRRTVTDQNLVATLAGRTLTGVANDPNGALISNYVWTFAADAASFTGLYGLGTATPTSSWNGTRIPGVTLAFKPSHMKIGNTQFCQAYVVGSPNKLVNWAASAGTIDGLGNYTAPSQPQIVTITASPEVDSTKALTVPIQVTLDGLLDVSGTFSCTQPGNGTLFQNGTEVYGTLGTNNFVGTLNGPVLSGTNMDATESGRFFRITFSEDGNQFSGVYNAWAPNPTSGDLTAGTRQTGVVSIDIKPESPVVPYPKSQVFLANVAGTLDKRVSWSVLETTGGTITPAGSYGTPNLAGTYTIKATSVSNGTVSSTASVQVPFLIFVDPHSPIIKPLASLEFRATVSGSPNPFVTWSVAEASDGTITSTGIYTAPATTGVYNVVATSQADATKSVLAQITVSNTVPISVIVAPNQTQLIKGGTAHFAATVAGTTTLDVTWTCTAGTIDTSGNYMAPNAFGTYTVTATSSEDPTAFGTASVVVAPQAGTNKNFTYDLNGNLSDDGNRTCEWDAENRLVAVTDRATGHRSEFGYDGLGRRVEIIEKDKDAQGNLTTTTDKKYLWDGVEIAEERSPNGLTVLRRFYDQGFVDNDGTNLYYTKDHLGSIRELTDVTQAVRARYDYDPYGRVTKISGDRDSVFGFAGMQWHLASGLNFAVFRAYDPNIGRWISRDPVGEFGGVNLYAYVGGNVVNKADPLGFCYETNAEVYACKLRLIEDVENNLNKIIKLKESANRHYQKLLDEIEYSIKQILRNPGGSPDKDFAQDIKMQMLLYKKITLKAERDLILNYLEQERTKALLYFQENIKLCVRCEKCKK